MQNEGFLISFQNSRTLSDSIWSFIKRFELPIIRKEQLTSSEKITLIILTPQVTLKMTFGTCKKPQTLGTMQIILACSILFTFTYGHYLLASS